MEKIFISHESNDAKLVSMIQKHLRKYNTWTYKDVRSGRNYENAILESIKESSAAILILSPEFFSSDYIMDIELPLLMKKVEEEENFKIHPLLVRTCKESDLNKLGTINVYPSRSKPLGTFSDNEMNFYMREFINNELVDIDTRPSYRNTNWARISRTFNTGTEVTHSLRGDRGLTLYAGPESQFTLLIPINNEVVDTDLRLRSMDIGIKNTDSGKYLSISCTKHSLNRAFFMFCELIDDLFVEKESKLLLRNSSREFAEVTNEVLKEATKMWRQLTSKEVNRVNQEKGLLGELWFLKKIINEIGTEFIEAWRGPELDQQDFRFGNYEFEVKTTSSSERSHYISSISQLEPSPDFDLYLISIQISPTKSKESMSIRTLKKEIESLLSSEDKIHIFHNKLKIYMDVEDIKSIDRMNTEYIMSSEPMYIKVDDSFPKFSMKEFEQLKHKDKITDISYRLNVEGLGDKCSNQDFIELIRKGIK